MQTSNHYVSTLEAANELLYSRRHIQYLFKSGDLKGIKVGQRGIGILRSSLDTFKQKYPNHKKRGPKTKGRTKRGTKPIV